MTRQSKQCDIYHYCCFLIKGFKFRANVCSRCHGLLMMSMNLSDIAFLNIKTPDHGCIISRNSKGEGHKLNAKYRFDLRDQNIQNYHN